MQTEKSRLIIHTAMTPEPEEQMKRPAGRVKWRVLPLKKAARPRRARPLRVRKARTRGEKLLRNTAIACALLMTVLTTSKIDQPWSRKLSQTVSSAVTMRIDLDETLGRLSFVRDLMPDAALVFWNMGAKDALARPVAGALIHAYDGQQPWLEYQVQFKQPVYAAADGTVVALSQNERGEWTLMLDHENGEQTVYAFLDQAVVKVGQALLAGAQLGATADQENARLYFELRKDGVPLDPTERMAGA